MARRLARAGAPWASRESSWPAACCSLTHPHRRHRWSVAVGLTPRVSADSKGFVALSAAPAVQRREALPVPERESTPPGLTRRELRGSSPELPDGTGPWWGAQTAASAEGASCWVQAGGGRAGGAVERGTTPADPTVALLVQRLEVASSDAGYFRHKADSSLALALPHASTTARLGAWAAAHAWGEDDAEALGALARGKMALRLQSLSTAALTISLDACWCKSELASVLRSLEDYSELALPAGEVFKQRGVAPGGGSGKACCRAPVAEPIEGLDRAGGGNEVATVARHGDGSESARGLARRLEEREAQLVEREDDVAMLRALLEEARSTLADKDAVLQQRAADLDAQTRRVEMLLHASPDAGPVRTQTPGTSTPPSAKMKATSSFKGAAVQKLAAVFESGGNVVETQAAKVLFASGKVGISLRRAAFCVRRIVRGWARVLLLCL